MKVICAPDKFKGSLTAADAAAAMKRGILRVCPRATVDLCPVADGGEGTVPAFLANFGPDAARTTQVLGPRGQPVNAAWVAFTEPSKGGDHAGGKKVAVIEMAAASGVELLPLPQRDPTMTSTYGTGQLIAAALKEEAERIVVGIGGSATTDGGCGCAQALGAEFYDEHGRRMDEPITGGMLSGISRITIANMPSRLRQTQIWVACDVTNPLTGPQGAAAIYGPQKGATPAQVAELDAGLRHLAALWCEQFGVDVETLAGAGAAGGLGAGLVAFLGAGLRPGIEIVLDTVGFAQRVAGCDLCLTGEGRLDGQTLSGKAVLGVARAARARGVRTIALVGSVGDGAENLLEAGLAGYEVIGPGLSIDESKRCAAELLETAAAKVVMP